MKPGHALVGAYSKYADPVHKISIVPRGRAALGYTIAASHRRSIPHDANRALTIASKGCSAVGRPKKSASAKSAPARKTTSSGPRRWPGKWFACMACRTSVGLVHCAERRPMFLPGEDGTHCSAIAAKRRPGKIDAEVKHILDERYLDAKNISDHPSRPIGSGGPRTVKNETLDAETFRRLIGRPPEPIPPEAKLPGAKPLEPQSLARPAVRRPPPAIRSRIRNRDSRAFEVQRTLHRLSV